MILEIDGDWLLFGNRQMETNLGIDGLVGEYYLVKLDFPMKC